MLTREFETGARVPDNPFSLFEGDVDCNISLTGSLVTRDIWGCVGLHCSLVPLVCKISPFRTLNLCEKRWKKQPFFKFKLHVRFERRMTPLAPKGEQDEGEGSSFCVTIRRMSADSSSPFHQVPHWRLVFAHTLPARQSETWTERLQSPPAFASSRSLRVTWAKTNPGPGGSGPTLDARRSADCLPLLEVVQLEKKFVDCGHFQRVENQHLLGIERHTHSPCNTNPQATAVGLQKYL